MFTESQAIEQVIDEGLERETSPVNACSKPMQVWYHDNCNDGFGAAWAAYRYLSMKKELHKVSFTPVRYNEPTPAFKKDQRIFIVDFSYPRKTLEHIIDQGAIPIVLDHHKTAKDQLENFPEAVFDMERSGAAITWSYFHKENVPLLLKYVQDNDLWKHVLQDSKSITRYISSFKHTFLNWNLLYNTFEINFNSVLAAARGIEQYFQTQIETLRKDAALIKFTDPMDRYAYEVPIINCSPVFVSELCNSLVKKYKAPFAIGYSIDKNNRVKVSLRGDGNFDVSAIATRYGGGGHKSAAGFETTLPILNYLLLPDQGAILK